MLELEEIKADVGRAIRAAHYSMDYFLLRIILDSSKLIIQAYKENNYKLCSYIVNKCLWDVGIYVQEKMKQYSFYPSTFFDDMANNIEKNLDKHFMAFSPENLKRCVKLVELANKEWFDKIAYLISWSKIADALDQINSFEELKAIVNPASCIELSHNKASSTMQ